MIVVNAVAVSVRVARAIKMHQHPIERIANQAALSVGGMTDIRFRYQATRIAQRIQPLNLLQEKGESASRIARQARIGKVSGAIVATRA